MSRAAPFTRLVLERGLLGDALFRLADVGASGGIHPKWCAFDERLRAIGFDPLLTEVERLNAKERRPGVTYEAAFVGSPGVAELLPPALRVDRILSASFAPSAPSAATGRARTVEQSGMCPHRTTRVVAGRGARRDCITA